jgi:osmoprotectant transport system permease protein
MSLVRFFLILLWLTLLSQPVWANEPVRIGTKLFTESEVLGEIIREQLRRDKIEVALTPGTGGTIILWSALQRGALDIYPDYTGTIREQILKLEQRVTEDELRHRLSEQGIGMSEPLGFNNTYVLAVRTSTAKKYSLDTISDLRRVPMLKFGVTHEFLDRRDGFRSMVQFYDLPQQDVRTLDYTMRYVALAEGGVDVISAFSTDARIKEMGLKVLRDDKKFFPDYQGVVLYRLDVSREAQRAINALAGTLSDKRMRELNAIAEKRDDYYLAAQKYFEDSEQSDAIVPAHREQLWEQIIGWTVEHVILVGVSLGAAILVGIPLGIRASIPGVVARIILSATGMLYTIPSLALLAMLVPVFGISPFTAICALFLYSLLPIVRNTATGLQSIPLSVRDSAQVLGLSKRVQLTSVYLPMASRTILAGIKTSTILNIGTATLAALIGAGGLGEPILSGISLNSPKIILQGAIPVAFLALFADFAFVVVDRFVIPRGLKG